MNENTASYTDRRGQTKFLGVVFGYLFIGLAITAVTAVLFSYLFYTLNGSPADPSGYSYKAMTTLWVICGVSLVVMLIDSIVFSITLSKSKKGAWIPYIIYCLTMGLWPGALLALGVQFEIMGEAFGFTALVFLIMFAIGYFSKANLSSLGMAAIGLLIGYLIVGLFFGIWFWVSPSTFYIWDFVASLVMITYSMLMIGFEANRMNRSLDYGVATSNTALYYAYQFYCDSINIFLRIVYILLLVKDRN